MGRLGSRKHITRPWGGVNIYGQLWGPQGSPP